MAKITENPQQLIEALGFMCKRRNQTQLLQILEVGTAQIEPLDEDHDRVYYRLEVEIPLELFAELGEQRDGFERILSAYADELLGPSSSERVSILNLTADWSRIGPWRSGERTLQASTSDVARLWQEGHFRLFLSHSSVDKRFCSDLKDALSRARIDTFVAHQDIEPNQIWQHEIKLALASCHGLLFVATKDSNNSSWCQQELGWAIGRGILVTTYSLGQDPVGFAGAHQGWEIPEAHLPTIAKRLVEMFIKDDRTEPAMREPIVQLVQSARTSKELDFWLNYLDLLNSLSRRDLERLNTVLDLWFVVKLPNLRERLLASLTRFGYSPPPPPTATFDEYDPFAED